MKVESNFWTLMQKKHNIFKDPFSLPWDSVSLMTLVHFIKHEQIDK